MSVLTALKATSTLNELATLLGYKPSALAYLLYKKPAVEKYKTFTIPKRSGGTREIKAPTEQLNLLQRRLADLLLDCLEEIQGHYSRRGIEREKSAISHAFRKDLSIYTNGRKHRNSKHVFNIDLVDFFGTINFGRVRGFFISNKDFELNETVATLIAQIACVDNSIPQGSPCSPVISNLIGHILDIRLVRLAAKHGCTYSRYADDITFSTSKSAFPAGIAVPSAASAKEWFPSDELVKVIERSGFQVNAKKTRMQARNRRQEVTGLVVNKKVNVKREYQHKLRAMLHRLFRTGSFEFKQVVTDISGKSTFVQVPGTLEQLHGMLGYVDWVRVENSRRSEEAEKQNGEKKVHFMRRFLIYKEIFVSSRPVILCEGKTDNVYLNAAIRSRFKKYPELVVEDSGNLKLLVRLFKYTESASGRILGLHGGSAHLAKFIHAYKEDLKEFKAPGLRHPVILLIDNDDGAKSVLSAVDQVVKGAGVKTAPFIHVFKNLYVVLTPVPNSSSNSMIEDLFDASIKATVLGGKKFNPANDYSTDTQYGKSEFAHKVVKKHASTVDFSGFDPLLDRIKAVMADYALKST